MGEKITQSICVQNEKPITKPIQGGLGRRIKVFLAVGKNKTIQSVRKDREIAEKG